MSQDSNGAKVIHDEFCTGTAVDDHWIITTASCCIDNLSSTDTPHGRVYANFGSVYSSVSNDGNFDPNGSGRFLENFISLFSWYIIIYI